MENNDKKMTFPKFMSKYHILIPIIQRDYAQGRRNAPKSIDVRASFIPALKDAVCNGKELSLDFIYGLTDGNEKLLLLDGQQRITTLLLFAWYCQKHSQEWHFNYAARSVDDEFITQLLKTKFDYSSLPSEFVMKQNWYFASWQDDPTVSGMLCMLDEIHKHLEGTDALTLTADFSKISFYIHVLCSTTTMAEYNKIFLKMNARGKALDDWENAKAILDKNIPSGLKGKWSERINKWQENLWDIIPSDNDLDAHIKTTNEIMHRIVKTVLRRCYRQMGKDGYDLLNYELDEWLSDNNDKKEFYMLCQRYFDAACSNDFKHYWITLRSEHPLWNEDAKEVKKDCFFDIMKDRISYANSLKYAFLVEYFGNQEIQPRKMRILLNLLDNTNINKENFYELCDNGLAFLREEEKEISDLGFNRTQTEDEQRKQRWDENAVKELECDPLIWQGSCSFLYYNNNEEYAIDNIKNNLSGIRKLIEQDWKSYFCNILSQISYNNEWWAIPEKVRIPQQEESLWAEYIFANHKENMRKWLQKLMQQPSKEMSYPAWLEYLKENILCKEDADIKYVKFAQGWNYCVPDNKITNGSIRLPWNDNEAENFKKLETSPITWDMHKKAYCKAKDGNYYYKIDDESWWNSKEPKKFIKKGSGEFIEQQMNN
ncbi:MAG: DUF262 domain-containing protein [Lentisphaerae bacterium]|nr:DUF262 domain-containing protein [Lentisphaerota bacterium]